MSGAEAARLSQAIDRFTERSEGQELPDGLAEVLGKAQELLKEEPRRSPTPGERAAGISGKTTGRAATGTDASPGVKAALSRS